MNVGPWQIILIVVVIVLLFGAKRLPDTARSVGRSMRIFKSEMQEMTTDDEQSAPAQIEKSGNSDEQNGYVASQTDKKKQADEA